MIKISQIIKEARLEKGLTLNEVSKATKIKEHFLQAIEEGEYEKLPSPAYAQGFVKNYAIYLGLSEKKALALFRREFDTNKNFKILPSGFSRNSNFSFSKLRIRQRAVIVFLIFIAIIGFIFYQYKDAIFNPSLDIFSPEKGEVFNSSVIPVTGKTDPDVTVFVNNIPVNIEQNGAFKKNIAVFSKKTTIEIKAVNSFGKQTIVKREVEIKSSP